MVPKGVWDSNGYQCAVFPLQELFRPYPLRADLGYILAGEICWVQSKVKRVIISTNQVILVLYSISHDVELNYKFLQISNVISFTALTECRNNCVCLVLFIILHTLNNFP